VQLTQGSDEVAATMNVRPDGRTFVEEGPLDDASAAFLRGAQVDRLVVPESALSPNPLPVTLAQPFELAVRPGIQIKATAEDPGLTGHFADARDPVLAAHQLLADLAVIYFDRPGQTRGVVVATPQTWTPNGAFLQTLLDGMANSPLLAGATLDTLFGTVPVATRGRAEGLVRTLLPDARIADDIASLPVESLRVARARLDAFASALSPDSPVYGRLARVLLTSESEELPDGRAKQTELDLFNRLVTDQLALIQLPSARKITLTARTGRLPITILWGGDYPLQVVLRVDSDNLSFPGLGTGTASAAQVLHKGDNPVDFTVRARTAGSFPLHITVLSPDRRLVLSSTTFTVQSTALSGVGLVLSIGAALFLAVWWTRQAVRNRRARRTAASGPALVRGPGDGTGQRRHRARGARALSPVPGAGPDRGP
jgi:hypothetical protein